MRLELRDLENEDPEIEASWTTTVISEDLALIKFASSSSLLDLTRMLLIQLMLLNLLNVDLIGILQLGAVREREIDGLLRPTKRLKPSTYPSTNAILGPHLAYAMTLYPKSTRIFRLILLRGYLKSTRQQDLQELQTTTGALLRPSLHPSGRAEAQTVPSDSPSHLYSLQSWPSPLWHLCFKSVNKT